MCEVVLGYFSYPPLEARDKATSSLKRIAEVKLSTLYTKEINIMLSTKLRNIHSTLTGILG